MKRFVEADVRVLNPDKSSSLRCVLVEADDYATAEKMIEDYSIEGYMRIERMRMSVYSDVYMPHSDRRYRVDMAVNDERRVVCLLVGAGYRFYAKENAAAWAVGTSWVKWFDGEMSVAEVCYDVVLSDVSDIMEKF